MSKGGGPGLQGHPQPPDDGVSDAGQPARARAGDPGALGARSHVYAAGLARAPAGRATSCTTARRTPTATSTSATRSTRSSRTSIVKYKSMAGFQRAVRAGLGLPRPADRARGREEARQRRRRPRSARSRSAGSAASTRRSFVDVQREEFKRLGVIGDWANPYLTTEYGYEATEVRELAKFVPSGELYRGKKPVHWCPSCQTALAEAEVEYRDVTTRSIYVAFPLVEPYPAALRGARRTPGRGGDLDDDAVDAAGEPRDRRASRDRVRGRRGDAGGALIVAQRALAEARSASSATSRACSRPSRARELEGVAHAPSLARPRVADHPRRARDARGRHRPRAHRARPRPGGLRGRPALRARRLRAGRRPRPLRARPSSEFGGMNVFEADAKIIAHLDAQGRLLARRAAHARYPHCWRCHTAGHLPRHRAVVHLDGDARICAAARSPRSIACSGSRRGGATASPAWSSARPDWCISRQRAWGVPIVALHCEQCGTTSTNEALLAHVADDLRARELGRVVRAAGRRSFVPPGFACAQCGGTTFTKEEDILDVWFDSGVSFAAVVERRAELGGARRPLPRGQRPASRLVPELAAHRRSATRGRAPVSKRC